MIEVVGRWWAGTSDWHPLAAYEIVLEHMGTKWRVTYRVHGEPHAFVSFESESEARHDIKHLMTICPPDVLPWHEVATVDP
ncbi:hypothetical protein LZ318_31290 [Saccharopolyspora indica]|uniref:hypothetical protein n=1 Tax=Saccharopolyspora indica TaxID=1229659 RepID=UPI0022EA7FD1|nr:hypothetical protein [Saccharopolyspora indica]MDA3644280.1 hypothetical protein [Saccharopolyspora indica]